MHGKERPGYRNDSLWRSFKRRCQISWKRYQVYKSTPGKLKKSENIFISKRSFFSIYGFALVIFLAILFIRREQIRRNSDLSLSVTGKAAKIAGKRLQEASKCLKSGRIDKFYEEILKAIWGYLSDKLNIPVSDLTRNNAFVSLKKKELMMKTLIICLQYLINANLRGLPHLLPKQKPQIFMMEPSILSDLLKTQLDKKMKSI